ncbi:unnamed protein product [Blepharisma stoltei]|uniref:RRM domain-containing protein n=1 Tax=Blepharisma stoltei TaxID=1481888 RepID=A0AAU9K2C6_9CILI|nr:unnamed protein product [Blepharisma stoltei]
MAEDIPNEKSSKNLSILKVLLEYHLFEKKMLQKNTPWKLFHPLPTKQDSLAIEIKKNISAFVNSSIEETSKLIKDLYKNLDSAIKSISNIEKDWDEFLDTQNKNIPAPEVKLSGVIGITTKEKEKASQSEIKCKEIISEIQALKCPPSLKIPPYAARYRYEEIDHDFSNQKKAENKHADSLKTDVLISGLNKEIRKEDLLYFFRDSHPGKVKMPISRRGKNKGYAIITFPTLEDARNASRLSSQSFMGSIISVELISNENLAQKPPKTYTIHVQNFNFHTSDESISRFFRRNGVCVECIRIPHFPSGQNKGFGFVVLLTKSDFKRALKLDGLELEGRELRIEVAC